MIYCVTNGSTGRGWMPSEASDEKVQRVHSFTSNAAMTEAGVDDGELKFSYHRF